MVRRIVFVVRPQARPGAGKKSVSGRSKAKRTLSPFETGLFFDAFLEITEQAADHVPLDRPANLNISMLVHANNRAARHTGIFQITDMQLAVIDDLGQGGSGHLDKLHLIIRVHIIPVKHVKGQRCRPAVGIQPGMPSLRIESQTSLTYI